MCAAHLWSDIVQHLRSVKDPKGTYKKARGSNLRSIFKLYFDISGHRFKKTDTSCFIELLSDMRDALVHDRPEAAHDYSSQRVDEVEKWRNRLTQFLSNDEIEWLPRIRETEPISFSIQGEPPILKFMKYPVAKMIYERTRVTTKVISKMMFERIGNLYLAQDKGVEDFDKRILANGELFRLWQAGE